jgi:hypothetical protein
MVLELLDKLTPSLDNLSTEVSGSEKIYFDSNRELTDDLFNSGLNSLKELGRRNPGAYVDKAIILWTLFPDKRDKLPLGEKVKEWLCLNIKANPDIMNMPALAAKAYIVFNKDEEIRKALSMPSDILIANLERERPKNGGSYFYAFDYYFALKVFYPDVSANEEVIFGDYFTDQILGFRKDIEMATDLGETTALYTSFPKYLSEAKLVLPKYFSDIVREDEWREMLKFFHSDAIRSDPTHSEIVLALNLLIISSKSTVLTPDGYKIATKLTDEKPLVIPVERSY